MAQAYWYKPSGRHSFRLEPVSNRGLMSGHVVFADQELNLGLNNLRPTIDYSFDSVYNRMFEEGWIRVIAEPMWLQLCFNRKLSSQEAMNIGFDITGKIPRLSQVEWVVGKTGRFPNEAFDWKNDTYHY